MQDRGQRLARRSPLTMAAPTAGDRPPRERSRSLPSGRMAQVLAEAAVGSEDAAAGNPGLRRGGGGQPASASDSTPAEELLDSYTISWEGSEGVMELDTSEAGGWDAARLVNVGNLPFLKYHVSPTDMRRFLSGAMHPADQARVQERLKLAMIASETEDQMEAERSLQMLVRGGAVAPAAAAVLPSIASTAELLLELHQEASLRCVRFEARLISPSQLDPHYQIGESMLVTPTADEPPTKPPSSTDVLDSAKHELMDMFGLVSVGAGCTWMPGMLRRLPLGLACSSVNTGETVSLHPRPKTALQDEDEYEAMKAEAVAEFDADLGQRVAEASLPDYRKQASAAGKV